MQNRKPYAILALVAGSSLILSACATAATPVVQTVVVKETQVVETVKEVPKEVEKIVEVTAAPAAEWTTPHPILGDVKVRQAIAHCTDRDGLIAASYPFLSPEDQSKLRMDTWIPKSSPLYANPNSIDYTFDITAGGKLLDEAGWTLPEGGTVRQNANGEPLLLRFTTTNAQFRQTWAAVLEDQLAACGIVIQRSHVPASIWFGSTSGLQRRDFDLGAFAWVGQADQAGESLYACDNIPTPANNWKGQNYMGWCNEDASIAIRNANNTLDPEARKEAYTTHQDFFVKDMVSLPLFQRAEAGAYGNTLKNVKFDPTEYYTANAAEWEKPGGDTMVLAFTQEPATMFSLVESAAVQRQVAQLMGESGRGFWTQNSYDFQTKKLEGDQFPTTENGGAVSSEVELKDGDKFIGTDGSVYQLKDGKVVDLEGKDAADIKVKNAAGEEQPAAVGAKAPQIVATYKVKPDKWSDGEPVKKADRELAYKVDCDKTSGAVTYDTCDRIAGIEFVDDNTYIVTFVPGYQAFFYYVNGMQGIYPSHQVIQSEGEYKGKTLAEVAPKDFATLPEVAELPLGTGPYVLKSWDKGQKMTLEANPNYMDGEPKVKNVIVQFFGDTNGAVAALLAGDVDVVGAETLGAGSEVQAVLDAVKAGKPIEVFSQATPTWEHVDFNLNVK